MADFVTYQTAKRYKVYVTWVDHGTYVKDARTVPALENLSMETGRNIHITGFRLDGAGDPFKFNVVIPQEIQGSFKVPQIGDVIIVEEEYRNPGASPTYIYSVYNDLPLSNYISSPIPPWGSVPGDYGHLRSHHDHNAQFYEKAEDSFTKKFMKSVTGYRFRKFYGHVYGTKDRFLDQGKFVVRGDSVFDVTKDDPIMSEEEINTESGVDIVSTPDNALSKNQGDYPNPLNVPAARERDERYVYVSKVPVYLEKQIEGDVNVGPGQGEVNLVKDAKYKNVLKNKNYFSYQPIVDKRYFEYLEGISSGEDGSPVPYERELPASEEYQVALRGNNKLLIQDQYGDGEQLLITLKNQYDAGFTVVHNAEYGQVRIRDHLGQGVLLEANPDAPRVISWTANRQVIEQGSVADVGEFTYIRNGSVFGDADTTFGKTTGLTKSDVSNQEFLMVSTPDIIGELFGRLSSGMNELVSKGSSAGIYIRNNVDPEDTSQEYSMFKDGTNLVIETRQVNNGESGTSQEAITRQEFSDTSITQTNTVEHTSPGDSYSHSDVLVVSSSGLTRTVVEEKTGEDKITTIDSISGSNTASTQKIVDLPLVGNKITITGDGAIPSFVVNVVDASSPVADFVMNGSEVSITSLTKIALTAPAIELNDS